MTPHIEAKKVEIAKTVILPGDPLRAKYIAEKYLTDYKLVNKIRNMLAYTGYYKGKEITVMGSGMGIPSIGIYAYELYKIYDVDTIIRIGSCGTFNEEMNLLDVILAKSSYSLSNFTYQLSNEKIKEVESDEKLNNHIIEIAKNNNINIKYGKIITSEVFDLYVDDHEKFKNLFPKENYLGVEMEAYALFYLAKKLNKKATCLLTVVDSNYDKRSISAKNREKSLDDMILLSLNSIIN